ncbi:hypothetical protein RB628_39410 [Streptomyces sp. ADMS]|uniref:hypothetical protein n=1 Tax=Streptomyces sp. ADMS TaxID=3071415 RepID=UPI00296E3E9C|nr:hypothetical protein [Streptomyces sp. ADMS]MDW4911213.1 hypothetical protein [Streptomyces sp. ADMS]
MSTPRSFSTPHTPGYHNNEGMPRERNETYADGPVAFHDLLRRWRADGGMDDVQVGAEEV